MNLQRSHSTAIGIASLILAPYFIGFSPNPEDSTSTTSLSILVGGGEFSEVSRDCSGGVASRKRIPYRDVGLSVDHEISPIVRAGVKMGEYSRRDEELNPSSTSGESGSVDNSVRYITPNAGLDTRYAGLSLGLMMVDRRDLFTKQYGSGGFGERKLTYLPNMSIRLGELDHIYLSVSLYDNLPIVSGGGLYDFGFGLPLRRPHSSVWFGISGGPYDAVLFSTRGEYELDRTIALLMRAGISGENPAEYGLSVGTRIRF